MPKYCILRVEKLNADRNVRGSLEHALRHRETMNASKELAGKNQFLLTQNIDDAMKAYQKLLPEKIRKNGVRCLEYVATVGRKTFAAMKPKERLTYFQGAIDWLRERHGENLFHVAIHNDETTTHISAFVVPIDPKGNLNARHFCGGAKKLSAMQDEFHEKVGAPAGLDRGIKGSKARHETIRSYYGKMAELEKAIMPPKRKAFEKDEAYVERYKEQLRPILKRMLEAERLEKRNDQLEADLVKRKDGFRELTALTEGLTEEQKTELYRIAHEFREETKQRREIERLAKEKGRKGGKGGEGNTGHSGGR